MCGIYGTVGVAAADDKFCMRAALRHRGPNDDGSFSDGPARIGMVRLSIIDLSGGRQPMSDEAGNAWIVFNGEIYNYRRLRDELISRGHRFTSQSDTEVIIHLYEEHGERCVEFLNGDFAFAIWDKQRRQLFIARDRLGVKPLYYWRDGKAFAFASELKALLCLPQVSRALDLEAIDAYLSFLYIPSPLTPFRAIRKLPPGHRLTFQEGDLRIERYWQPPVIAERLEVPEKEVDDFVLSALQEAVTRRLMSDVPLGAFLSGGLDSTTIVALMRRADQGPVRTFSVGFDRDPGQFDERESAALAAKALGSEHRAFAADATVKAILPQLVWHLDEPHADSSAILTYLLSQKAKRSVTVALTGIGGDEVFGGYPRYLGAWASEDYAHMPLAVRRMLAAASRAIPESGRSRNVTGWARRFLGAGALEPADRYLAWRTYLDSTCKRELYGPDLAAASAAASVNGVRSAYRALLENPASDFLNRIHRFDLQTYLPDDLLMLGDKMSMAHGLEIRVPFCDHTLIEAMAKIPMRTRMQNRCLKALMKRIVRPLLPDELLKKPKQGFMVPLAQWLTTDLTDMCEDTLGESSVRRRGFFDADAVARLRRAHAKGAYALTQTIYALLVLELWCRLYVDERP